MLRNFARLSTMPNLNQFLTTQDAAKKLGFSTTSIRNLIYQQKLRAVRIGRTVLIEKRSFMAYRKRTRGMKKHDPRRRIR